MTSTSYVIGVDIGGTCTDCVVVDDVGKATLGKALSTPSDFSEGVLNAVRNTAEKLGLAPGALLAETRLFLHSTTVAENAVVDGTLARGGLLLTRGFEDTLFLTRGGYGRWAGLTQEEMKDPIHTDKPEPLIPTSMVRGIKERTDCRGLVIHRADEAEVEQAIQDLVDQGAETIGVSFLWSFANPENENAVKAVFQKLYPDRFFTASHEIAPVIGEFERTQTVALNVGLGPFVSRYLHNLETRLCEQGFRGRLLVMQAYGGLLRVAEASMQPVGLIESGPVSGLVGSKSLGHLMGSGNIVAADMGGTTFKAGVIREGLIEYQREPLVYRYPYAIPKMDVVSIGVAGGSIISLDPQTKTPRVGPRSAGAYPGPVCYGFGGVEPTVTDLDLLLGYLNPRFFLGGREKLDVEKPRRVFEARIASPLGLEVPKALAEIYRLTNSLLLDWLHKMTIERGLDLRNFLLFAYGGTAGMHLVAVGEELGVSKVVVPHTAAVHGAFGLVSADVMHEYQVTRPMRAPVPAAEVQAIFAELRARAAEHLQSEGFAGDEVLIDRSIDMRFRRQLHKVTTPVVGPDVLTDGDLEQTYDLFERMYRERYGPESAYREAGIELITFRVRATGKLVKPEVSGRELAGSDPGQAFVETRKVYFHKIDGVVEAAGYDFEKLYPGNVVEGPAIIWTPITTIVVNPGQRALADRYKNVLITWH